MTAEEWRPIPGFPGYEVSSLGRIASTLGRRRRLLKPWTNANGYLYIELCGPGGQRKRTVHSLVLEAFHGPREPGQVARHLDGRKQNNAASNLRFGSPSENSRDAVRHGTHPSASRTHCPQRHEYTPENTYSPPGVVARFCRECNRQRSRVHAARRRAALRRAS